MVITLLFFLLFTFLIVRLTRRSTPTLSIGEVTLAFGLKALLACAYGYIFLRYYHGDDTWEIHAGGLEEWKILTTTPVQFFLDLLPINAWKQSGGNLSSAAPYYIDKLEWHLQVKTLAIANLFTRGNYYANAVFFSFLTFWGHFLLYRLATREYAGNRNWLLFIIFGFPPVLFWLSGIRSDGWLFLCFAGLLYQGDKWMKEKRPASLVYALICLTGIFIFRNELLLVLLPGLLAWYLSAKRQHRPVRAFLIVYGAALLLVVASTYITGIPNALQLVVNRQQAFLSLTGNTRFALSELTPHAGSFLQVLPQAFTNAFLRPFVWEARGPLQILSALEVLFFWGLLVAMLVRRNKNRWQAPGPRWHWLALFFSVLYYLLIGFVVPFPGAIVRYKAIPELLLLVLMVSRLSTASNTEKASNSTANVTP
ncbi:hypothetical protein [Paraflavitalea pollutisoli]|uniref:hypothetical protein n=1 Tax=Paraflavitalea pollutisoli TaxID=3034143 RepID=UPI0023EA7D5D|nr:hypothetical protein [Paraflavitalea sp. H1-2-19X]